MRKRNDIASEHVQTTSKVDADFVGWCAYSQLMNVLNRRLRASKAMIFETFTYLVVSWIYRIDEKIITEINSGALAKAPPNSLHDVADIVTKYALIVE